jgi:hypothetical protein
MRMLEVKFYTVLDTSPCNLIGECVRQIEITKTNTQLYLQPQKMCVIQDNYNIRTQSGTYT